MLQKSISCISAGALFLSGLVVLLLMERWHILIFSAGMTQLAVACLWLWDEIRDAIMTEECEGR
jgi:hypothetical protein